MATMACVTNCPGCIRRSNSGLTRAGLEQAFAADSPSWRCVMDGRSLLLLALFAWPCTGWSVEGDPVTSVMWDYHHAPLLDGAPFVFDEQVRVVVPPFAEDARQVPVLVDASAYQGRVVRILAWAELNPIAQIFDFAPGAELLPRLAIRIRIEQATPIRAAVLTRDGVWHVGSSYIDD